MAHTELYAAHGNAVRGGKTIDQQDLNGKAQRAAEQQQIGKIQPAVAALGAEQIHAAETDQRGQRDERMQLFAKQRRGQRDHHDIGRREKAGTAGGRSLRRVCRNAELLEIDCGEQHETRKQSCADAQPDCGARNARTESAVPPPERKKQQKQEQGTDE